PGRYLWAEKGRKTGTRRPPERTPRQRSRDPGPQEGSFDISSRQRRISDALNRRCPPRVRIAVSFPARAQRVTVLGFTRNSAATSLGVSRASGEIGRAHV